MILTQGERAVWAAAFVEARSQLSDPNLAIKDGKWDEEHARRVDVSAAEQACAAVLHLRNAEDGIVSGYGAHSDLAQMLRAMLGDEG